MGPPKATKANKYQAKCPPRHASGKTSSCLSRASTTALPNRITK